MKKRKKLLSILLAATMTLAMAAPTFAATDTTLGTITIGNAIVGEKYTAYQIFGLESFSGDAYAYTISSQSDWYGFVTGEGAGASYVTLDHAVDGEAEGEKIYYVTADALTDATAAEFAKLALKYAADNGIEGTTVDAEATTITFSDLPLGYYLVDSSVGALCSLNTTDYNAEISEKNSAPDLDKQVQGVDDDGNPVWADDDENTASVGDTINYRVTITARKGAENYVLHDDMSDGLTFGSVTGVTMNGTSVDESLYNVVSTGLTDGCDFELSFTDNFYTNLNTALDAVTGDAGVPIVISYTAVLNKKAVIAGDGNTNTAGLEYGNETDVRETPTDTTTTYTYEFDLVKTKADNTLLNGAKFELYGTKTGEDKIALVKDGDAYRVATTDEKTADGFVSAEIEAGHVVIKGLSNGTYWLEETEAPAGYNKLAERESVEITDDNNKATLEENTWTAGGLHVVNNTGALLPGTGGIGTTIFYAAGIILMAGAVFFVVRRKRA